LWAAHLVVVAGGGREGAQVQVLYERCAGIDVHKDQVTVAVRLPGPGPGGRDTRVRKFAAFYGVLREMAGWLASQGVTRVAMEATGIYTMPVYHALLEPGCFDQVLVCNAAHVKNVPGRKTDLLTELRAGPWQVSGRMGALVVTVADRDHKRRWASGSVAAGGAAVRVA
jgi:transposase